jgi:acyl-CoA synthetase (AMP-forming)/AMP-acid ligase II
MLLHAIVDGWAADAPDDVALVHPSLPAGSATASELAARTAACARWIGERVPHGGRVALVGANHPGWVDAYAGVPGAGRLLVLLNHRLAAAELVAQLERSGATVVVGAAEHLDRLVAAGVDPSVAHPWDGGMPWEPSTPSVAPHPTDVAGAASMEAGGPDATRPVVSPDDPAWLLFTSGTTGTPKGALLTHASLLAAVDASAGARPVEPDDTYLFCFPLCHVAGYNVLHRHANRRPVVLLDGFVPDAFCRAVAAHQVTSTSLAATMLAALCDHLEAHPDELDALHSLRVVAYGAAPMPLALLRRAHDLLGVDFTQGYGMTELSGNAVFLDAAAHHAGLAGDEALLGAAGRPAPGVEVRVVDADTDEPVAVGLPGEIVVRAPQVMAGYWQDPVATADTLRGGWLHTGDVGVFDPTGLLTVVDRSKDVIITGGENVASREVEEAVLATPEVAAAAVVGVPDATWGENVCAVVVPRPGAVVDPDAVVATVRQRLAGFKAPRHVVVVDALPVNAAGKVLKAELRRWLADDPDAAGPRR